MYLLNPLFISFVFVHLFKLSLFLKYMDTLALSLTWSTLIEPKYYCFTFYICSFHKPLTNKIEIL